MFLADHLMSVPCFTLYSSGYQPVSHDPFGSQMTLSQWSHI